MHASRRAVSVVALLLIVAVLPGCIRNLGRQPAFDKPTTLEFSLNKDVHVPDRPVVIFLCDGLRKDIFEQMLDAGELPSIKHFLIDRGVTVDRAVTSLPTVTYAVISSYATGRYPGHSGILGNKWFDTAYLVSQDYTEIDTMGLVNDDITGPTLYELLDHEKSVVVLSQINRGASYFYENWMRAGVAWFFKMFGSVSMSTTARLQNTADQANRDRRWPDLVTLYYPATDEVAHIYGVDSPQYRDMIRVFDNEIGDACKAFKKEGILDRMLLVLVTDHGMTNTPNHLEIRDDLTQLGARLYTKQLYEMPAHYWARVKRFGGPDTIALVDSHRLAKLYFRMPGYSWNHRPSLEEIRRLPAAWHGVSADGDASNQPDLISHLLAQPGVKYAVHCDRQYPESHVYVFGVRSHDAPLEALRAVITRRIAPDGRKLYSYRVLPPQPLRRTDGSWTSQEVAGAASESIPSAGGERDASADPFGYSVDPVASKLCDGQFHSADEWMAATIDTECPDFVSQLPEMFDSPRASDLCLFAESDWDFANGTKGGHGGLLPQETIVPLIFAGGGLPGGTHIPYTRTVAVAPTVFDFIRNGSPPTTFQYFDADSILDNLRAARENAVSNQP